MVPMHTMTKVKPRQVNIGLAVARAILWALNMVPELRLLVFHLTPMDKSQYGIRLSYVALHLQHLMVLLHYGNPIFVGTKTNHRWLGTSHQL